MSSVRAADFRASLPAAGAGGRYVVAFSGGLDSTVLLHLLTHAGAAAPVHVVHVHHGLQAQADDWALHCQRHCTDRGLGFELRRISIERKKRRSQEADARAARYATLRESLRRGDVLLTAHHQDDQAETFLLQALRGAGPRGLAGMPAVSEFPPGLHARPLLGYSRAALRAYAEAQGLTWIEDPSNRDPRHLRNHLRAEIMPRLCERWPQAAELLARSAALSAGAAALLDELAMDDIRRCTVQPGNRLHIPSLLELEDLRRDNLLRVWIGTLGLPLPEQQHILRLSKEVLGARADRSPVLRWPGAELRRYRDLLFAMPVLPPPPARWEAGLHAGGAVLLPTGCGRLEGTLAEDAALRAPHGGESVKVRLAKEGERIRLPDRRHHHALKDLCQQAGIPPWVRRRLPVVLFDDRLAAVADRWVAAEFARKAGPAGLRLRWRDPPAGYCREEGVLNSQPEERGGARQRVVGPGRFC